MEPKKNIKRLINRNEVILLAKDGGKNMYENEIKEAKQGNKESLSKIILENIIGLYRIAYAITGNEEDSKDAIGFTTLKVCEKIHSLKKPEFFKTWMIRILINECKNIIKKKKKNYVYK